MWLYGYSKESLQHHNEDLCLCLSLCLNITRAGVGNEGDWNPIRIRFKSDLNHIHLKNAYFATFSGLFLAVSCPRYHIGPFMLFILLSLTRMIIPLIQIQTSQSTIFRHNWTCWLKNYKWWFYYFLLQAFSLLSQSADKSTGNLKSMFNQHRFLTISIK